MAQLVTINVAQLVTIKMAKRGPVSNFTACMYIYIYAGTRVRKTERRYQKPERGYNKRQTGLLKNEPFCFLSKKTGLIIWGHLR